MSKNKAVKKRNSHFIAKVIFCIVMFNIVVRSDLWISLCVFIYMSLYLLQAGFLSKLLGFMKIPSLDVLIDKAQKLSSAWYVQNEQQPLERSPTVKHLCENCKVHCAENKTEDSIIFSEAFDPSSFTEESYEDIWRNSKND